MAERGEEMILRAIRHAAVAGALSTIDERDESVAAGLLGHAEDHRTLARAYLTKWAREQDVGASFPADDSNR